MNHRISMILSILCLCMVHKSMVFALPDFKEMGAYLKNAAELTKTIYLKEIPGLLTSIPMPDAIRKVIGELPITITKLSTEKGIDIEGTTSLKGTTIQVELYFVKKDLHFSLMLPEGINFEKLLPELGQVAVIMDKLELGRSYFILSTHDFTDDKLQLEMHAGFNIGAIVALTGILQDAKKILDQLKKTEFLVLDRVEAVFQALISPTIVDSAMGVVLPFRIGIDFTKKPFAFKDPYIRRVYSANFIESIDMKMRLTIGGGIFVELGSQKDKLEFRGTLQLDPKTEMVLIGGQMNGMYMPAFGISWFGLGPLLGLQMSIMAVPPWINGYGIAGGFTLGDVIVGTQGLVAIDLTNLNYTVEAKQKKIDVDQFIKLLFIAGEKAQEVVKNVSSKVTKKIKIPEIDTKVLRELVPTIEFTDILLRVVPTPAVVFGETYKPGIYAQGGVHLGDFEGSAGIKVNIFSTTPSFSIEGQLKPLQIKIKDLTLLRISGKGPDNSAQLKVALGSSLLQEDKERSLKDILKADIRISGQVEIPPISFKTATDLYFHNGKFKFETNTTLGVDWLSGHAKVVIDPTKPQTFEFDMAMDQNFVEHIKNKTAKKVAEFATGVFEIKSAAFHTDGKELMKGKLPSISLSVTILGKDIEIKDLAFDFKHPDAFFETLLASLAQFGSAWKVHVTNDTPYSVRAQCLKVGLVPVEWETIAAGSAAKVGCGAADCSTGIKVKVTFPNKKVITLKSDWRLSCGNKSARVMMMPVLKSVTAGKGATFNGVKSSFAITDYKVALGANVVLSTEIIPYQK